MGTFINYQDKLKSSDTLLFNLFFMFPLTVAAQWDIIDSVKVVKILWKKVLNW